MPLAFQSISHGTIAFGFFNIESDLLILDHHFIFANDFCHAINQIVNNENTASLMDGYCIEDNHKIGDLHGGIAGTHYSGFIGDTYRQYPFPQDQTKFKQQTEGFNTRQEFQQMIKIYSEPCQLTITANKNATITIGSYVFTKQNFQLLISYVIDGGYPRWKDETAPNYVKEMQETVTSANYF